MRCVASVDVCGGVWQLTLSALKASGLFPKGASGGGVKAYVLLTCGGARRLTPVAPKGQEAQWDAALTVATHGTPRTLT
jgi:hypothetical protein